MITYEMIKEFFQEHYLPKNTKLYNGKFGVGLVYSVKINDYGKSEDRLATFDTLSELEKFFESIKYCDEIQTDNRELINSSPTFYLRGKILTPAIISEEKEKERRNNNARKEYMQYEQKRGQLIAYKIELLNKEITELKELINSQDEKRKLLFNNEFETATDLIDVSDIPTDMEIILGREDIPHLKTKYDKLLKERDKLKKIILEQKSLSSQVTVDDSISSIKDNSNLINEEFKIRDLFKKYDKHFEILSDARYFHTKLILYKKFDNLPIGEPHEQFFSEAEQCLKDLAEEKYREYTERKQREHIPTKQEKMTKLFENLKMQFDNNLTNEQKEALILYNSRFFEIINMITSIPNYESMDGKEILEQLSLSKYTRFLAILYEHSQMLYRKAFAGTPDNCALLEKVFQKTLPPELYLRVLLYIHFKNGNYEEFGYNFNNDNLYLKFYQERDESADIFQEERKFFDRLFIYKIVDNIKDLINILKSIPEKAIVLPEDITVFRGVNSLRERSQEKVSTSLFMSTSTRPEVAKKYGGKECYIYKVNLKKGTPVLITPYKVFATSNAYEHSLNAVEPSDPDGTKEIIVNLGLMKDFVLTEPTATTPHYVFKDNEFIEEESGYIITGEMKPKKLHENCNDGR